MSVNVYVSVYVCKEGEKDRMRERERGRGYIYQHKSQGEVEGEQMLRIGVLGSVSGSVIESEERL